MSMVKKLAEMALEEAESACHYAKWGVMCKDDNPSFAKTLTEISAQELSHMTAFDAEAVKMLEQCRQTHPDEAVAAGAVYDYIHEKTVEAANHAKMYQTQFKSA